LGVDLRALIVVRVRQYADQIWALDQALRCPAVAAVWAPLAEVDERDFRRLQLATEEGGSLGLLVRSQEARRQPSWSDIRLWIETRPGEAGTLCAGRRLRIAVTRCRQGRGGGALDVEIDEATGVMRQASSQHEAFPMHSAPQLAYPAIDRRSTRAP
jgi:hypothetical protein